jgi:HSP20 family protein
MLVRFDPSRAPRLSSQSFDVGRRTNGMPFDAYRQGDTFFAHFDLPGIDPSSVSVTVEKNVLTVSAERTLPAGDGVELIVNERPSGSFTRQLFLGDTLASELIVASWDNGVLTVAIPVAEKAKPRKVEIGATTPTAAPIEASASV